LQKDKAKTPWLDKTMMIVRKVDFFSVFPWSTLFSKMD
jgi:hypothetical protein